MPTSLRFTFLPSKRQDLHYICDSELIFQESFTLTPKEVNWKTSQQTYRKSPRRGRVSDTFIFAMEIFSPKKKHAMHPSSEDR